MSDYIDLTLESNDIKLLVTDQGDGTYKLSVDTEQTPIITSLTRVTGTKASSGDNTVISGPGSGNRLVVTFFLIQNESSTATTLLLKDGSDTKFRVLCQNQGDGLVRDLPVNREWRLAENSALVLNLSGANSCGYSVEYYTEAV